MKQQDLHDLENHLVHKYGPLETAFGNHRCLNGFKLVIWTISVTGLLAIYVMMLVLEGAELLQSPLALVPLLFVGVPLFLFCSPWERDWKGYVFDNHLVTNSNGRVAHWRYIDICDLKISELKVNGVVLHYSVAIGIGDRYFMLPPMNKQVLAIVRQKVR